MSPRRMISISLLSVLVVVLIAAAAGLLWFFSDDAPAAVSLGAAAEGVTDDQAMTASGDITGAWTVDAETGEFDYESATGTFVGFRVEEELAAIGSTTAVGRTGDVTGTMVIDGTTVSSAVIEVDLSTITTDESRRDDQVHRALDTDEYPTATFTLAEPIELGDSAAAGDPITVTAGGDLTIHGVTNSVELQLEAQLVGETIVIVGSTDITFSDYGVEVPSSPAVLSVDDDGTLELQLLWT